MQNEEILIKPGGTLNFRVMDTNIKKIKTSQILTYYYRLNEHDLEILRRGSIAVGLVSCNNYRHLDI